MKAQLREDQPADSLRNLDHPLGYVGYFIVEDASGARFFIYEYRARRWLRTIKRFQLEIGEDVRRLDTSHFAVIRTCEVLLAATSWHAEHWPAKGKAPLSSQTGLSIFKNDRQQLGGAYETDPFCNRSGDGQRVEHGHCGRIAAGTYRDREQDRDYAFIAQPRFVRDSAKRGAPASARASRQRSPPAFDDGAGTGPRLRCSSRAAGHPTGHPGILPILPLGQAKGKLRNQPAHLLLDIPCQSLPRGCPAPVTLPRAGRVSEHLVYTEKLVVGVRASQSVP
jgi:hypothetical protein